MQELSVLEYQMSQNENPILMGMHNAIKNRIKTAGFLEQFGDEFVNTYPKEIILAKELLDSKIPTNVLSKYAAKLTSLSRLPNEPGLEDELNVAAHFAYLARSLPRCTVA